MMRDKTVEQFKVGDGIRLYGFDGTVVAIDHQVRDEIGLYGDKTGNKVDCTYLQVNFDDPATVGSQYNNGWYGGLNGVVAYGFFER